jgi:hypothetical protein
MLNLQFQVRQKLVCDMFHDFRGRVVFGHLIAFLRHTPTVEDPDQPVQSRFQLVLRKRQQVLVVVGEEFRNPLTDLFIVGSQQLLQKIDLQCDVRFSATSRLLFLE